MTDQLEFQKMMEVHGSQWELLADTKRRLVGHITGHINIHHHEDNRLVPMADRYLDDKHSCKQVLYKG